LKSLKTIGLKNITCILVLVFASIHAFTQINNSAISDREMVDSLNDGHWGFSIQNFNYLRNTEYFNEIESGQTLFGTQLSSFLWLQANPSTKIRGGVFLNHSFGSGRVDHIVPVISLMHASKYGTFVFGTLNGAASHNMIEPLFNINNTIERKIEQGAQFFTDNDHLFLDAWINWQNNMQWKGDEHERFTAGFNISPAVHLNNYFRLGFPVQFLLYHKGGQQSTDTTRQYSAMNGAVGLSADWELSPKSSFYWDYYFLLSNNNTKSDKSGMAQYSNLSFSINDFTLMFSWFRGIDFYAQNGTYIYQSQSRNDPDLFLRNRELLFLRVMYNRSLNDQLRLSARFEPFYDFYTGDIEFSYSLYLVYKFGTSRGSIL
jgi:hypothetical protein